MVFTTESVTAAHASRRRQLLNLIADNERLREASGRQFAIIGTQEAELRALRLRVRELEV
jgi:hypothetical protein